MNGYDESGTILSLAKQIMMDCEGVGMITIQKDTLKLVLNAYVQQWNVAQDSKRSDYKKVATNAG